MSRIADVRRNWRYSRRSHHTREESLDMVNGRVLDLRRDTGYIYAPDPSLLTWSDQSGWGHHCTAPASANQPTVVANGVDFDGAASPNGDYLINTALGTALGTVGNLYVAVVFRADVAANSRGLVSFYTAANVRLVIQIGGAAIIWRTNNAAQSTTLAFSDTASYHIAELAIVSGVGTPYFDSAAKATLSCGALSFDSFAVSVGSIDNGTQGWVPGVFDGVISNVLISTDPSPENVALARRVLLRDKP